MIEITIKGEAGVGKSSVALLIVNKLMDAGFDNIELNLLDQVNDESEWIKKNDIRIGSIKEMPIKIVEKMGKVRGFTDK